MSHPSTEQSLGRLASIERQLIMQELDNKSRLSTARCSRTLRAEASHPFSWKHAEPVTLQWSQLDERLPLIESSLLRLAPIHLYVDCELQSAAEALAVPRLRGLASVRHSGVFPAGISAQMWAELLLHPSTQQLRTLDCQNDPYMSSHLALIAQLPHLTSLAFFAGYDLEPDDAVPLSTASASLTSIRCCFDEDYAGDVGLAVLPALANMPQLRRLWLADAPLTAWSEGGPNDACLRTLLTSPHLAQLTHLTLQGLDMRLEADSPHPPPTPADCDAAFAALTHLTHLRLIGVSGIELLLPSVVHARSLEQLQLYVGHPTVDEDAQPGVDVLRTLVESLPLLHIHLLPTHFEPDAESWPTHAACAQLPRVQAIHLQTWVSDILQDEFGL